MQTDMPAAARRPARHTVHDLPPTLRVLTSGAGQTLCRADERERPGAHLVLHGITPLATRAPRSACNAPIARDAAGTCQLGMSYTVPRDEPDL